MSIYGSPGLGSVASPSLSSQISVERAQKKVINDLSAEIKSLRQETARLSETITNPKGKNTISFTESTKKLDVI